MFNASSRSSINKKVLTKMLFTTGYPPIRIALWDGTTIIPPGVQPKGTLVIRDWRTLLKLAIDPELHFGDAYTDGSIEVQGDLVEMLVEVYRSFPQSDSRGWIPRLVSKSLDWSQANTLRGSRRNIHRHYDIGNDFYRLWLDSDLLYTCAYYPTPNDDLETAQVAKMNHVCRKLRLRPGDRVVEAGCGWGSLALHMARHYGASVKAYNISAEQISYARRRAEEEGLSGRVEFLHDDYRNITGKFDVFVSVGMLEHVGPQNYRELGGVIDRSLDDMGRGFLHFIGRNRLRPLNAWIRRRIFPGAYPPTLRQVMDIFEPWNFSVLDVENIRLHYARTLEQWLERFENSASRVALMFGPEFVRAWRLYLAGSIAAFRTGSLQLFQIAFARQKNNQLPWTRDYLYAATGKGELDDKCIAAMS
jgi:cyclopropane-fatty-acyl-phospholipid synthase